MKEYGKFARHLAAISWKDEASQQKRRQEIEELFNPTLKSDIRRRYRRIVYKFKCLCRRPFLIDYFDKRKGTRIEKIYTFCAYDLLDYGPLYFAKRLIRKVFRRK